MREPRCIRYFNNMRSALAACDLIRRGGFEAEVKEQKIGSVTLDRYDLPLKFQLYVERDDINKIAKLLSQKLRAK